MESSQLDVVCSSQVVKRVTPSDSDPALELGPLKPADSGNYSCLVNNSIGSDAIHYRLRAVCEYLTLLRLADGQF